VHVQSGMKTPLDLAQKYRHDAVVAVLERALWQPQRLQVPLFLSFSLSLSLSHSHSHSHSHSPSLAPALGLSLFACRAFFVHCVCGWLCVTSSHAHLDRVNTRHRHPLSSALKPRQAPLSCSRERERKKAKRERETRPSESATEAVAGTGARGSRGC